MHIGRIALIGVALAGWCGWALSAHPRISTSLTWQADIQPLFARQCVSCHAGTATPLAGGRSTSGPPTASPPTSDPPASDPPPSGLSASSLSASDLSANDLSTSDLSTSGLSGSGLLGSTVPLVTYADVRPWARAIREEVLERRMPPARGRPGLDSGVDDHPLSPMERDLIVAWIDGGLPEGRADAPRAATFWCRMHPEVRADREGTCPRCGMTLVAFLPDLTRRYGWSFSPATVAAAGRTRTLTLSVIDQATGTRVQAFERVHEQLLHLFIVREDFRDFAHVHPQIGADGRWSAPWRPASAGRYWLYGDFLPTGGGPQLLQRMVTVGRPVTRLPSSIVPPRETGTAATDHGVTGTLLPLAPPLRTGDASRLTIDLRDAATRAPITDLEPYLGAWGHLFVVHEGRDEALHAHPEGSGPENGSAQNSGAAGGRSAGTGTADSGTVGSGTVDSGTVGSGTLSRGATGSGATGNGLVRVGLTSGDTVPVAGAPSSIAFEILFPRAGTWYLWLQVQRRGTVITLPFVVQVAPRA